MGSPTEKLAALTKLDQGSPRAFGVKLRLGELYLGFGQPDVAAVYLGEAARLGRGRGISPEEAHAATLEYARVLLLQGKPSEATRVVMPDARRGDPASLLLRARASIEAGDTKAALEDFRAAFAVRDAPVTPVDHTLYARALAAERRHAAALHELRDCEQEFGYQPGTGFLESSLLENLGRPTESILAAFKETLYQESQGTIDAARMNENLGALSRRLRSPEGGGAREQTVIRGLRSYLRGKWSEGHASLSEGLSGLEDPFGRFLLLACSLEKGPVTSQALTAFAALEPRYRTFPEYYYRLWRAVKKGGGHYTFSMARSVLEKAVLLAPASREASESRAEIARLVGLDAREAGDILLRPELDLAYARLLGGGDPRSVLAPVLRLIAVRRENIYTSDAVLMLKSAAQIPGVAGFLAEEARRAGGTLKDRLSQIL